MAYSKISFTAPTTYADGVTPLPSPDALTFNALIDTVNPPVKSYVIPTAETSTVPGAVITATFAQLGFAPAVNTTYYATATASDATGTSADGNIISFTYVLPPAAVSGFTVA